jgi:hypothetical protein
MGDKESKQELTETKIYKYTIKENSCTIYLQL